MSSTYQAHLTHLSPPHHNYTDLLVEEWPLTLYLHRRPYATFIRTPGHDLDLIKGFLWTEGLIDNEDDLSSITSCPLDPLHRIDVYFESGISLPTFQRARSITASCGLCSLETFKHHSALKDDRLKINPLYLDQDQLNHLYTQLNSQLMLFKRTGGAHGALLFDQNLKIYAVREDIGRHNALDQVLGVLLSKKDEFPQNQWGVILSSRAGFELISKALQARLSTFICLGASSGLAHRTARNYGLPLYSFVRPNKGHLHSPILPS